MTNNETKTKLTEQEVKYNCKQEYSEKDKEKDISIVQQFLDKVEKRLGQRD